MRKDELESISDMLEDIDVMHKDVLASMSIIESRMKYIRSIIERAKEEENKLDKIRRIVTDVETGEN